MNCFSVFSKILFSTSKRHLLARSEKYDISKKLSMTEGHWEEMDMEINNTTIIGNQGHLNTGEGDHDVGVEVKV